uniref:S-formylglutathione hydrolase n=1 Tax=Loa loa TaxID=7209 RepID=A0A1I7VFG7_LOALO
MDSKLAKLSSVRCFGGYQRIFSHYSTTLKCTMKFGIYIPDLKSCEKLPVLMYLSGLTCTEANFIEKSGFQRAAAAHRMVVLNADTSPRGVDIPGDSDCWDFGKGAGFYVDATEPKWSEHYRMYTYITDELPNIVRSNFVECDPHRWGIMGHSMGGHGAIVVGLRNPEKFLSISAFAPICNPMNCKWGRKAFLGYLGPLEENWKVYDSLEVIKCYDGEPRKILIDQGTADNFLAQEQLLPRKLENINNDKVQIEIRYQEGYDHSYFFIASFIDDHFAFHHKILSRQGGGL